MARKAITRAALAGMLLGAFTLGYGLGSVHQPRAHAMGGILEQAGKGGGPLAAAAQLGSSITEMQDHVTGLQKNLETLRKVQSALTGK